MVAMNTRSPWSLPQASPTWALVMMRFLGSETGSPGSMAGFHMRVPGVGVHLGIKNGWFCSGQSHRSKWMMTGAYFNHELNLVSTNISIQDGAPSRTRVRSVAEHFKWLKMVVI